MNQEGIIVKDLAASEKSWTFLDGSKRNAVLLNTCAIGLGMYLPGWRWSEHVGKNTTKPSQAHIGYVISGKLCIKGADSTEKVVGPGQAFEVGPNYDAWVVGDEPCVTMDFEHLRFAQP